MNLFLLFMLLCDLYGNTTAQRGTRPQSRGRPRGNINGIRPPLRDPTSAACIGTKGSPGTCEALSHCIYQFENVRQLEQSLCQRSNNEEGTCCSDQVAPAATNSVPFRIPQQIQPQVVNLPNITSADLDEAGRHGMSQLERVDQIEEQLRQRGLFVQSGTSTDFHQDFFGRRPEALDKGRDGYVGVEATRRLAERFRLNSIQSRDGLPRFNFQNSVIQSTCPTPDPCPSTKYRLRAGTCNNLKNPNWGQSFSAFQRLVPPSYSDGIDSPRNASDGGPLPSPRLVSLNVAPDGDFPHELFSLTFMQWGQFVAHDITLAGLTRARDGSGIRCCDEEIQQDPERLLHPACFTIAIPSDDTFFSRFNQNCMEFVRSLAAPRPSCTLGPREQMDQVTSFLDASHIYGSTEDEVRQLRMFEGGRLRTSRVSDTELLPQDTNVSQACAVSQANQFCFRAGDTRVNQHTDLTSMHTIFFREHNRIVTELSNLNPGWTDEILYQEARRIMAAIMQHITFNEFLPLVLGKAVMSRFDILLKPTGFFQGYDQTLNPTIINGFATAAYRFGHSTAQGLLDLVDRREEVAEQVPLSTQFFNPLRLYRPGQLDQFLRGLVNQPVQNRDRFVTDQLTNHLFEPPGQGFGLDLVSINIQRGRDHGLPGYNTWREICGLPRVTSFEQLDQIMNPASARAFARLYKHVDDIDFFAGVISERSLPNSVLGPTSACIVAEQFRRLRKGDRFWYENGNMESSFSELQLIELRKVSLARIMCDNADNIQEIQVMALFRPANWNPRVACQDTAIPRYSLLPWKNEPVWS